MALYKKAILTVAVIAAIAVVISITANLFHDVQKKNRVRDAIHASKEERNKLDARIEAGIEKSYHELTLSDFNKKLATEIGISNGESYTDTLQKVCNYQYPGEPMRMHMARTKIIPKKDGLIHYFFSGYDLLNDKTDRNEVLVVIAPDFTAKAVGVRFKCFNGGDVYSWRLQPC